MVVDVAGAAVPAGAVILAAKKGAYVPRIEVRDDSSPPSCAEMSERFDMEWTKEFPELLPW